MVDFEVRKVRNTLQEVIGMIEVTKLTSKGQVTIPSEVRKALNLKQGSKIGFVSDENGRFYIVNASLLSLKDVQDAFIGVAKELGIDKEEEVLGYLKKAKKES